MAPRKSSSSESSQKDIVETDYREVKIWSLEWVQLAIFISSFGVKTEIDIDGRITQVFCVIGYNCRGFKYVIQVWGSEAASFEEFFRSVVCVLLSSLYLLCFTEPTSTKMGSSLSFLVQTVSFSRICVSDLEKPMHISAVSTKLIFA
jgi:hypothetical protein